MKEPYASGEGFTIYHGDCRSVMASLPESSVDAIVTDPPYGLTQGKRGGSGAASVNLASPYGRARVTTGNGPGGFMGKAWDAKVPGPEVWAEALRVAKPGAHLVAFGGTRTFHRLTCGIEDAGWEIRDCLSWLYGSGFPKSLNGAWGGTALKPAWEPCILARKPLDGTVAGNFGKHGTGGLNPGGVPPLHRDRHDGAVLPDRRGAAVGQHAPVRLAGCRMTPSRPPIRFTVPGAPLSLNHAFPTGRNGRRFPSPALKRWKAAVAWSAKAAGVRLLEGPVSVRIVAFFPSRRGDLDNVAKPILDGLAGIAYANDRQVEAIEMQRRVDRDRPRVELEVRPLVMEER